MNNKRNLKHKINCVCADLFSECVAASLYGEKSNEEDIQAILSSIVIIHNDYIRRISHQETGIDARKYYNRLLGDFNKQVSEIIDQISSIN